MSIAEPVQLCLRPRVSKGHFLWQLCLHCGHLMPLKFDMVLLTRLVMIPGSPINFLIMIHPFHIACLWTV